ncbi:MAG: peptide-methionine (S)-S-oxide reductase MsrA [Armatimonadetes bacterium]|nr:peptide-methionine (S)-S-oxide reductase MsrA [Armatimonadota bacterium]
MEDGGSASLTPTKFKAKSDKRERAVFAGGCFWGLEYRFRKVDGVTGTAVGYSGGTKSNPTYEDVCSHTTGHAESVMVEFDPASVSYRKLADLFFTEFHNPTTKDRQGPDVGDSYRSVLFYANEAQLKDAKAARAAAQKGLAEPIVTELVSTKTFWPAEEYHQDYINKTGHFLCPIEPPKKSGGG